MDFLLTCNCKDIANPFIAEQLLVCFSEAGVHLPVICTPEQFLPMTTTTLKSKAGKTIDSVIAEVRRTKVKLLERFNYDLDELAPDARARQSNSGHEVVDKSTGA